MCNDETLLEVFVAKSGNFIQPESSLTLGKLQDAYGNSQSPLEIFYKSKQKNEKNV